ncbi:glycerate kinase [Enterococcus gallinarum]|uniref:glycerate kinase n=1 Tax=Enterococcus gallinarum TaxID=1353 RepID=UPI0012E1729A|nr:glycerate kinase [Enterococcus gallinarum]MUO32834.1 glycerate kinase [Enterococcus gallinarum]
MKVLTVIDSFKGSFTSQEANHIVANAFRKSTLIDEVIELTIADGGEGTIAALTTNLDGEIRKISTKNLLGETIQANFGWIEEKKWAIIEVAEAVSITFLDGTNQTHPSMTNSFGVGLLIKYALNLGAKQIIIGLGGTGVIDLGWGAASALGLRVYDKNHTLLEPFPVNFSKAFYLDSSHVDERIQKTRLILLNDVSNPLFGSEGAIRLFGKQKGLLEDEFSEFELSAKVFADIVDSGMHTFPGDGAAGGIGFMFRSLFDGGYQPGFQFISESLNLEKKICTCDLVITGEGHLDYQSLIGKVPFGVANLAKQQGIACIAFTGKNELNQAEYLPLGIDAVIPIVDRVTTLDKAIKNGKDNLKKAAELTAKLMELGANLDTSKQKKIINRST